MQRGESEISLTESPQESGFLLFSFYCVQRLGKIIIQQVLPEIIVPCPVAAETIIGIEADTKMVEAYHTNKKENSSGVRIEILIRMTPQNADKISDKILHPGSSVNPLKVDGRKAKCHVFFLTNSFKVLD